MLFGAWYVSYLLGIPVFIAYGRMTAGRIASGEGQIFTAALVSALPFAFDAAVAGALAGWLVETSRRTSWLVGFAILIGLSNIMGHHWRRPPLAVDLLGEAAEAILVTLVGLVAFHIAGGREVAEHAG